MIDDRGGRPTIDDRELPALANLLAEAGRAHHRAFARTEGEDPEWPIWYARYLQPRLRERYGISVTRSELVHHLVALERERSGSELEWPEFYARGLARRLGA